MVFEFFNKFFKPITVLVGCAIGILAIYLAGIGVPDLHRYVTGAASGLAVTVLLWLWKQEKTLKLEIDKHQDLFLGLWRAFRGHIGNPEFERSMREIVTRYANIVALDHDHIIAQRVLRDIEATKNILKSRQYEVDYKAVAEYPEPFYESAIAGIKATNVVEPMDFWKPAMREKLLQLNREAVKRRVPVERVFVLDADHFSEYESLMGELTDAKVDVKWLDRNQAGQVARVTATARNFTKIRKLEDFTLFEGGQSGITYSGRFKRLDTCEIVLIASDEATNTELRAQFDALWTAAKPFGIKP